MKPPTSTDSERLAVYRHFRKRWLEILTGDDSHAIYGQLTALLDADLHYHTINHSRGFCNESGLQQCGMVHRFIDQGFLAHQALAIRRITEDGGGAGDRAVYSLPRIVDEMLEHRELITRESYVCVDGDPYDSFGNQRTAARHRQFDDLSGVGSESRSHVDTIRNESFAELRKRLKSSETVRRYANKFLAHAADPRNRRKVEPLTFDALEAVYGDLIWITDRLSANFLYDSSLGFLPSYAADTLEGITNPLCPPNRLSDLRGYWNGRREKLEQIDGAPK